MYDHVIWPHQFDPKTSAIYALNDIDVNAPPEVDEAACRRPELVELLSCRRSGQDSVRQAGTGARNQIQQGDVGFPMHLIVTECVPARRLAWSTLVDGDETDSTAYHGWVITPTDTGCHLLSEETQQGPFFLEELGRKNPVRSTAITRTGLKGLRAAEAEVA